MSQERISVYNIADLKNTSDDAIANYLNSLRFVQSHRLTDTHLALGYSAFAVAAACFLWDWKLGFEDTKVYSAVAVAVYVVLNGVLTWWTKYVERGVVYEAATPDGKSSISVATSTPDKYTPVYDVTVTIKTTTSDEKKKSTKPTVVELHRPFSEWFDSAGHFVAVPFQTMLASAVPVIGKADPKHASASASTSASTATEYTPEILAALAAEDSPAAPATASGSQKKGGRRRKN